MNHKCDFCGEEFNEWDLERRNIGRRIKWVCRACAKSGEIDTKSIEIVRSDRRRKIYESTKNKK